MQSDKQALIDYLENDLRKPLSDQEKQIMIDALEVSRAKLRDRGLLVDNPSSERAMLRAHNNLKRWAREYKSGSYGLIKKLTGYFFAGASKPQPQAMQDEEANRISGVIAKMTQFNQDTIFFHYIERPRTMVKLYEKVPRKPDEVDRSYEARVKRVLFEKMDIDKRRYYELLDQAKYEFNVRGGIS